MIHIHSMSGQIMSRDLSFEMKMPNQPQMVAMFRMPAIAFMMFQGPEIIQTWSTMAPPHRPYVNICTSRTTASAMLMARMSGGKHSAHRFSYRWCSLPSAPRHFTNRSAMKPMHPAKAE